eukprot:PhF_6_TR5240/c0_g1_i4/m.7596
MATTSPVPQVLHPSALARSPDGYIPRCPFDLHLNDDVVVESIMILSSSRDVDILVLDRKEERYVSVGGQRTLLCESSDDLFCVTIDLRRKYVVSEAEVHPSPLRVQLLGSVPLTVSAFYIFMTPRGAAASDDDDRGLHLQRTF